MDGERRDGSDERDGERHDGSDHSRAAAAAEHGSRDHGTCDGKIRRGSGRETEQISVDAGSFKENADDHAEWDAGGGVDVYRSGSWTVTPHGAGDGDSRGGLRGDV